MSIFMSVIVCTHNRCEDLKRVLDSLFGQEHEDYLAFEIIVVDNNSTDQTKEVVNDYSLKFKGRLRYAFESNQGLSFARNRGIEESKGKMITFTDDDCIVDKNWIQMIYACALETDFDALGGRILPVYPSDTPLWIKNNATLLCGPVLCHDYGEATKKYAQLMTPSFGANMTFKREIFEKYGRFRTDLGVGQGTMGDDTEFFYRIESDSSKIFYCGKALVWHPAVKERMTLGYIARWNVAYGKYLVVKDRGAVDKHIVCCGGIPRYLIRKMLERMGKLIFSCFNRQNFLFHWVYLFQEIGTIKAYRECHLSEAKGV